MAAFTGATLADAALADAALEGAALADAALATAAIATAILATATLAIATFAALAPATLAPATRAALPASHHAPRRTTRVATAATNLSSCSMNSNVGAWSITARSICSRAMMST